MQASTTSVYGEPLHPEEDKEGILPPCKKRMGVYPHEIQKGMGVYPNSKSNELEEENSDGTEENLQVRLFQQKSLNLGLKEKRKGKKKKKKEKVAVGQEFVAHPWREATDTRYAHRRVDNAEVKDTTLKKRKRVRTARNLKRIEEYTTLKVRTDQVYDVMMLGKGKRHAKEKKEEGKSQEV